MWLLRRGTWISRPSSSSLTRNFRLPLARSYQLICIESMIIQTDHKIVFWWLMRLCFAVILVKHFSHRIHLHPQFDFIPQGDRTFSVALHRRRHQWKHLCPYRLHFEWPQFTFFRMNLKKSSLAERYYFLCMITQFSCQKLFWRFENRWKIDLIRGW